MALGLANGCISIRNKAGEEKGKIERPGGTGSPIFGLAWHPLNTGTGDILCAVDWGQNLSFYTLGGQSVGKERQLGFDPLCISFFPDGEFLIISGCNKTLQLFTKEGVKLSSLGELHESWIWSTAVHPQGTSLVGF